MADPTAKLVTGINRFTLNVFRDEKYGEKSSDSEVMMSPLGLIAQLASIREGSADSTRRKMDKTMPATEDPSSMDPNRIAMPCSITRRRPS